MPIPTTRSPTPNNNVAYTGNGRLIDQYGNYASGTPVGTTSAYNWNPSVSAIPGAQYNQNQDLNALNAILNRVNAGESFGVLGGGAGTGIGTGAAQPVTQPSVSVSPGGYSGYGSTGTLPGLENGNLADILRQMYASNLDAQLAALRSTYEQDAAGIRAQDDLISRIYASQRNQTAAQNDIQRMQMAEFGIMNGLNTGSSGQMALAQSLAYQNALGELGSAEAQSLADNALNLERLSAGYRASVDQANANNNAQLAQALYNEYVRQINAVQQAQAAALAQQNWERQFAYQQQQDALSQANWERQFGYAQAQDALSQANWEKQFQYGQNQDALSQSNWERQFAYGLAGDLLQSGIMPDTSTLSTAGISQSAAQSLVNAYQAAINAQLAKSYASASRSSGGSSDSGKPKLTYAQAKALLDAGVTSPDTVSAFQYYAGSDVYNQLYNKNKPQSSGEDYGAQYRGINQTVYYMRKMGKSNADIIAYLERQSDRDLSDNGYKNIIKNYGLT